MTSDGLVGGIDWWWGCGALDEGGDFFVGSAFDDIAGEWVNKGDVGDAAAIVGSDADFPVEFAVWGDGDGFDGLEL